MIKKALKTTLIVLLAAISVLYVAEFIKHSGSEAPVDDVELDFTQQRSIAIFGASGTAGNGLLMAAMDDPQVQTIHVITRRSTASIETGISDGKVKMTIHMDYLDYSPLREVLAEVNTVYWAIGLSSLGVDEETYGRIHVDFPMRFVQEWTRVNDDRDLSFHYISGANVRPGSRVMWVREKARAEAALSDFATDSKLRVILYRPDYIAPVKGEAHFGQILLHAILAPVNSAVGAMRIGEAMLEVSARGTTFENGAVIKNKDIVRYSAAYQRRRDEQ